MGTGFVIRRCLQVQDWLPGVDLDLMRVNCLSIFPYLLDSLFDRLLGDTTRDESLEQAGVFGLPFI